MAKEALRYIATAEIAKRRKILVAGPLLADFEISNEPIHVTVVGSKQDAGARALFLAALKGPSIFKRIEWYDKKEGKLPNSEVQYPDLKKAAAFSCGNGRCSLPAFSTQDVKSFFSDKTM